MPINQTIFIKGKVGHLGANAADDVMAVQRQLNDHMMPPRQKLTVDGKCGPKTIAMIRDFQKGVCGFSNPDGRVDPGGKTLMALNNPGSAGIWARMSIAPVPGGGGAPSQPGAGGSVGGGGAHSGLSPQEQANLDKLRAAANGGEPGLAADPAAKQGLLDFLNFVVNNQLPTAKLLLNSQGLLQTALETGKVVELARGLKILNDLHYGNWDATARELADMVRRMGAGKTARGMAAAGRSAKVATAFKRVGNAAAIVGIMFAAFEVIDHVNGGRYGQAGKEAYKALMSLGVPWAAAIDAVQSVAEALNPELKNNPRGHVFFTVLKSLNLIDHGGNAVDSLLTILEVTVQMVLTGKLDYASLNALVKRMEESSATTLVHLGNAIGDWMGDQFGDLIYEHFLK